MDTFADGVFVRENLARERLANNDHGSRAVLVAIVEVASLDDRNAHRAEIADAGREKISRRMVLRRHRASLDLEGDNETIAVQWQWIDRARSLHSRRRFKTTLQVDKELALSLEVVFD